MSRKGTAFRCWWKESGTVIIYVLGRHPDSSYSSQKPLSTYIEPPQDCYSRRCIFSSEHPSICSSCWLTCKKTSVARFTVIYIFLTCFTVSCSAGTAHVRFKVAHFHTFATTAPRALTATFPVAATVFRREWCSSSTGKSWMCWVSKICRISLFSLFNIKILSDYWTWTSTI